MLHVLVGDDDYSIHQALEEIKDASGDRASLLANTVTLDGGTLTAQELRNACSTVPFFAEKRLVVVRGLLARYEAISDQKNAALSPELKEMVGVMAALPPFTELVLIDGALKPANPLLRELGALARLRTFRLLGGVQLNQWVERRVRAGGGSISVQAVNSLVRLIGSDLWTMANEVDKLLLYSRGRRIEEADVKALVSQAREEGVFALIDAVLEGRLAVAQEMLQHLWRQGISPLQLLVMLTRQVRAIFLVKQTGAKGSAHPEILRRLGLTSDFLVRKAREQAGRYSLPRLRELYHHLLEVDIAIKTGQLDGETALDILIAELGQGTRAV